MGVGQKTTMLNCLSFTTCKTKFTSNQWNDTAGKKHVKAKLTNLETVAVCVWLWAFFLLLYPAALSLPFIPSMERPHKESSHLWCFQPLQPHHFLHVP